MYPGSYGGEESQIGPVFIAIIPALLVIRKVETHLKYLILFNLTFFALWLLGYQAVRYATPIIPMMSLVLVFIYKEITNLESERFSKFMVLFILLCLGFNACLSIYYNRNKILVAFGVQSKSSYLTREERSYSISKYVNDNIPENSKIIAVNVPHIFYFDRPIFREVMVWVVTNYDKNNNTLEEVKSWLKGKGFTHILVREEANKSLGSRGSRNRLTHIMSNDKFKTRDLYLCHTEKFVSKVGNESTYSLYKIKD